jgi:hypothetical protein
MKCCWAQRAALFLVLVATIFTPNMARAQVAAAGATCTGAGVAAVQTTGDNLYCRSSIWTNPAYQFGSANGATCTSTLAGEVQWISGVLQVCDGTNWDTLGGSSGLGSGIYLGTSASVTNPARSSGELTTGLYSSASGKVDLSSLGVQVGEFSSTGLNLGTSSATGGALKIGGANGISYPTADANQLDSSIAIGSQALAHMPAMIGTAGIYANIAVGYQTMASASMTTAAINNTAVGYQALKADTSGRKNTALGYQAGLQITTGALNTVLGSGVASTTLNTGGQNILIGVDNTTDTFSGSTSSAIGIGQGVKPGGGDVAIGQSALSATAQNALDNTAIGSFALENTTTGASNVAIGEGAMLDNTSGNNNVAVGQLALENSTTGTQNVAVGEQALKAVTNGIENVAVGATAGASLTGGVNNVALGYAAGAGLTIGSNNVVIGYEVAVSTLSTGSNNILIGTSFAVDTPAAGTNNFLNIANLIYGTSIGTAATPGKVGIGTTSPLSSLSVAGNLAVGTYGGGTGTIAAPSNGLIVSGNVGIGTTNPMSELQVNGGEVQIGSSGASCSASNAGAIRYSAGTLYYCNSSAWTASSSGGTAAAAGSTGQVQFNTGGVLNADAGLFWDNTNKRLGIGSTAPITPLNVVASLSSASAGFVQYPIPSESTNFTDYPGQLVKVTATQMTTGFGQTVGALGWVDSPASNTNSVAFTAGVEGLVTIESNAATNFGANGLDGEAYLTGTIDQSDGFLVGVNGFAENDAGSSNAGTVTGGVFEGDANGGTVANGMTGLDVFSTVSGGTVTNGLGGIYVEPDITSGSADWRYGLFLAAGSGTPSGSGTNDYGIYQESTSAVNYFGGNVGIGTTSPPYTLTVSGAQGSFPNYAVLQLINGATETPIMLTNTGTGGHSYLISSSGGGSGDGNGSLTIYDATTTTARLLINSSGLVGIGTTAPQTLLDIFQTGTTNSSGLRIVNSTDTASARIWIDGSGNQRIDNGDGATGVISLNGAGSGNVGIGTTSPSAQLEVSNSGISSGIKLTDTTNASNSLEIGNFGIGSGIVFDPQANGGNVYFGRNFKLNNFIIQSGNVGIGTTAPQSLLDIEGGGGGQLTLGPGSGSNNAAIDLVARSGGTAETVELLANQTAGFQVNAPGNIGFSSSGSFNPFGGALLQVNNNVAIGAAYIDTSAPTNGLIVQGNVGIGTASPNSTLDVHGTGLFSDNGTPSAAPQSRNAAEFRATQNSLITIGEDTTGNANPAITLYRTTSGSNSGTAARIYEPDSLGHLYFQFGSGATAYGSETYTTTMALSGSNVGIGTTSPGYLLTVGNTDMTSSPQIEVGLGGAASNYAMSISGGRVMYGYDDTAGMGVFGGGLSKGFTFYVNGTNNSWESGTQALTITTGGNVGIGTASPSANLQVAGTAGSTVTIQAGGNGSSSGAATLNFISSNVGALTTADITTSFTGGMEYIAPGGMSFQSSGAFNPALTTESFSFVGNVGIGNTGFLSVVGEPSNGLVVQGNVGIGTTAPAATLDAEGTVKLGTAGTTMTAMGTCTVASYTPSNATANKTCTGVPASTAVAVSCSPSAAFTTPATTVLNARATGTLSQIAVNLSAANSVAVSLTCMWVKP